MSANMPLSLSVWEIDSPLAFLTVADSRCAVLPLVLTFGSGAFSLKEVLANWALLAVALAPLAFAAFSFAVGAWRYVHMGRNRRSPR